MTMEQNDDYIIHDIQGNHKRQRETVGQTQTVSLHKSTKWKKNIIVFSLEREFVSLSKVPTNKTRPIGAMEEEKISQQMGKTDNILERQD